MQGEQKTIAEFELAREIRFVDTDASGFAHFSAYVRMMEETEYAFLRSRGLCVVLRDERGTMGFPRLSEVLMHEISAQLAKQDSECLVEMIRNVAKRLDGAYSLAFMNAKGEMLIARDPLGIKPMCYAVQGSMFAAASESVALLNLGFKRNEIESLKPGHAITIVDGKIEITQFAEETGQAHCFFEWIYFANVASTLDDRGVYTTRTALGKELADQESAAGIIEIGS